MLVRMEIPISPQPMVFKQWLPLTEEEFITVGEESVTLKLWFDKTCTERIQRGDETLITDSWDDVDVFVDVYKIFVDVTVKDLLDKWFESVEGDSYTQASDSERQYLKEEYKKLGERIYLLTLTNLNRLIAFMRAEKGQYWLEEYKIDKGNLETEYKKFKAKVRVDEGSWFGYNLSPGFRFISISFSDFSHLIDRDTWSEAKKFLTSSRKLPLSLKLIAGAEELAEKGHSRSALTEGVTALEVAVADFAKDFKANKLSKQLSERIDISSLKKYLERVGLTGTINYVFPVLFSEEQMSKELLKDCQEAINQRQNVVHGGQREVQEDNLLRFLSSIRKMCSILRTYREDT